MISPRRGKFQFFLLWGRPTAGDDDFETANSGNRLKQKNILGFVITGRSVYFILDFAAGLT